jgi:spore germination protein YaaH
MACFAAAGPSAAAAPAGRSPSRHLAVLGFQQGGDSPTLIARDAAALRTVGVDGVNLTPRGRSTTSVPAGTRSNRREAHRDNLRAELLFGNWSSKINDFSEPLAHTMLSRRANRDAVAHRLAAIVRRQHWDGISLDLEALRTRDRAGLVDFLSAVRAALPRGRTITICISGRTSDARFRAGGYELPRIAPRVDRIEYMTYDQHGPWENTPGPVGALSWQRDCLRALLRFVPRRKIDLGVAGYGYAWRPHSNLTLSDRHARKLAGSHARWVGGDVGEWTAHLPDGSTLWWSDARSYRRRADLARQWRLHGLAVWNLQESDPIR